MVVLGVARCAMTGGGETLPGFDPADVDEITLCDEDCVRLVRAGRWWVGDPYDRLPADGGLVDGLLGSWADGVPAHRVEGDEIEGVEVGFFSGARSLLKLQAAPPDAQGLARADRWSERWVLRPSRPDLLVTDAGRWADRDALRAMGRDVELIAVGPEASALQRRQGVWASQSGAHEPEPVVRLAERWMLARAAPRHESPDEEVLARGAVEVWTAQQGTRRFEVTVGRDWVRFDGGPAQRVADAPSLLPDPAALPVSAAP